MYWLEFAVALLTGTGVLFLAIALSAIEEDLPVKWSWPHVGLLVLIVLPTCILLVGIEEWFNTSLVVDVTRPAEESVTDAVLVGILVGVFWDTILLNLSTPLSVLSDLFPRIKEGRVVDLYLEYLKQYDERDIEAWAQAWSSEFEKFNYATNRAERFARHVGELRSAELTDRLEEIRMEAIGQAKRLGADSEEIDRMELEFFLSMWASLLTYDERRRFDQWLESTRREDVEEEGIKSIAHPPKSGRDPPEGSGYSEIDGGRRVVLTSGIPTGKFQSRFRKNARIPRVRLKDGFSRVERIAEVADMLIFVDDSVSGCRASGPHGYHRSATQKAFLRRLAEKIDDGSSLIIIGLEEPNFHLGSVPSGWRFSDVKSVDEGITRIGKLVGFADHSEEGIGEETPA